MGYYHGQGDFYHGARGSIFSVLGGVAKKALSFIPGVGPIASGVVSAVGSAVELHKLASNRAVAKGVPFHPNVVGRMLGYKGSTAADPVGSSAHGTPAGKITAPAGGGGGGGTHVSRQQRRHLNALAAGLARARPRMNPFNPDALRRAERRAHMFLRHARKLVRYYVPKAPKGKAYIHTKRRAK